MNTVKHEIKLEKSVKIILGVFAIGIFLNAFSSPIANELFGVKDALAEYLSGDISVSLSGGVSVQHYGR